MNTEVASPGDSSDLVLLDGIVHALIEKHAITASDTKLSSPGDAPKIALAKAKTLSGDILGRIVFAVPNASVYDGHLCDPECSCPRYWLRPLDSGPYLLQQIAAAAIVCRMWDLLGHDCGTHEYDPGQMGEVV